MLDEFEDATWPAKPVDSKAEDKPDPVQRLISRIYAGSDAPLRVQVLQHLLDRLTRQVGPVPSIGAKAR